MRNRNNFEERFVMVFVLVLLILILIARCGLGQEFTNEDLKEAYQLGYNKATRDFQRAMKYHYKSYEYELKRDATEIGFRAGMAYVWGIYDRYLNATTSKETLIKAMIVVVKSNKFFSKEEQDFYYEMYRLGRVTATELLNRKGGE